MNIVATSGNWVLVEADKDFIFYDFQNRKTLRQKKKQNPHLAVAAVAKWGYLRLEKPVKIDSLTSVTSSFVKKLRKQIMKI